MDPLSIAASIIAILQLTEKVGLCLRDARDASKESSHFMTETSNLSRLLARLLSHVDNSSQDPWQTNVQELCKEDGLIFQYRIALEQLVDKISSGHGLQKFAKTFLWKYIKDDVELILSKIERLKSLVQIALQMDHIKLSQAIESSVTLIHDENKIIQVGVDAIQQDQDRQRHRLIMDWLSSADFARQQSDFIGRRQEETGMWFLNSHEFTEWVHGSSQTLFCPGIPGAGKTMMAAIAVDHLQKTVQTPAIGVAYLYCNYKRQAEQTISGLLAAMLKQLVQDQPSFSKPLQSMYDLHETKKTRPSSREISGALQSVLANYSRVYVVIDALDECPDQEGTRSHLLDFCRNLQGQTDLRFMATSRHIPDIVDKFRDMPQLEVRASNTDVKRYVIGQTSRLANCIQRDNDLQELIQGKIVDAVDGMFLLARLHVDSLLGKRTKAKVISTLDNLSKGSGALDDAYNEAIVRIDGQLFDDSALAKRTLSWISYAQRPLTTGELCHALAVELEDEELDQDNILDVEDIVSVCAGLVTVDEESEVIRLVHYTTQDYLEKIREHWNPNAQYDIASTCLTYLCFNTFRSGSCANDAEFESRIEQNMFLDYSARYWGQHVVTVQEKVCGLAMRLLQEDNLVACALQVSTIPSHKYLEYSQSFLNQATGLHLAASSGLFHVAEEVLAWYGNENVGFADSRDSTGKTPLSWAAQKGHEAVVKLLLERDDVKADSKDNRGRTPLSHAAEEGHEVVVKLLLERNDVEADSKDNRGRTPILWAVDSGHEVVVKLLLERDDVKADSRDNQGRTPLSWAVDSGQEALVKLLLERDDVEADSKDDEGQTPLSWAAYWGREAVVKLLLERDDVEADSKDSQGRTPLSSAAEKGRDTVVKLLLKRDDVEADSKDDTGRTPLSWAAEGQHKAIVKLLLERDDVEADSKGNRGRTPLSWAVEAGNDAVVKLLFERDDVEADSKDNQGRTPLSWAVEARNDTVVKLLLERDNVEADSKDDQGRTPLSWAVEARNDAVVNLLLERDDVEADSKDDEGQTPLSWAAYWGREAVVVLLLERDDVEADSKDNEGRTPLSWAAYWGRDTVVKLLLERDDVEADSKDNRGRTPLWWAAERGHEAVVKLLLKRDDVKADSKYNRGQTPLSWAAYWGREAVVKLLLKHDDVKADSKDDTGRTPLSWAAGGQREAVVKLLLERDDVDANSKDDKGRTPLLWAAFWGYEAVVKLLLERDDVEADSKDNQGRTPLLWAAVGGHEAVVKLLIERDDVDADSKDDEGLTPLSWAAEGGHEAVVKLLVERDDVDVDSRDVKGRTPLVHAGEEGVVKLLKSR